MDNGRYKCNNVNCTAINDKAEHLRDNGNVTKASTCSAAGTEKFTCTECSQTKTGPITIDSTAHSRGIWTITKAPTKAKTGSANHICTNDNTHTETITLSVLTDTFVWTKDAAKGVEAIDLHPGKDVYTSVYGKEVQSGANAPAATLTTPSDEIANAVLTGEEKAVVNDGKDIKIVLKISMFRTSLPPRIRQRLKRLSADVEWKQHFKRRCFIK